MNLLLLPRMKLAILFFQSLFSVNAIREERFRDCRGRWNCTDAGGFMHITYSCSQSTDQEFQDVLINVATLISDWSESLPTPVKILSVKRCISVLLNMNFNSPATLKRLQVSHISQLSLVSDVSPAGHHQQPADIVFSNIGNIPSIESGLFNYQEAEDIIFRDLTVGTIKRGAFSNFKALSAFIWDSIVIRELEESAVNVNLHEEGTLRISNSNIEQADSKNSISVDSGSVQVIGTLFTNVELSTISVKSRSFQFSENRVFQSKSRINACAQHLIVTDNEWENMGPKIPLNWFLFYKKEATEPQELSLIFQRNKFNTNLNSDGFDEIGFEATCFIHENIYDGNINSTILLTSDCGGDYDVFRAVCKDVCVRGVSSGTKMYFSASLWIIFSMCLLCPSLTNIA